MPPIVQRLPDGTVKTIFARPNQQRSDIPPGRILTLSPAYTPARKDPPIAWVDSHAQPCYVSHLNGHFLWDVPGSGMCDPDCECDTPEWWEESDDDEQGLYPYKYAIKKASKHKPFKRSPCHNKKFHRHDDDDEDDSKQSVQKKKWQPPPPPERSSREMSLVELMIETGHSDLVNKFFPGPEPVIPTVSSTSVHPISCIGMIRNPYDQDFPPLERRTDENTKVSFRPYVAPNTVDSQGHLRPASASDEVLNWHTQNAICQNTALTKIDSKLDSLSIKTDSLTIQMG